MIHNNSNERKQCFTQKVCTLWFYLPFSFTINGPPESPSLTPLHFSPWYPGGLFSVESRPKMRLTHSYLNISTYIIKLIFTFSTVCLCQYVGVTVLQEDAKILKMLFIDEDKPNEAPSPVL